MRGFISDYLGGRGFAVGGKAREKILGVWYQMSLKRKLYIIIGSVALMMMVSICMNLRVVYYFIDNLQMIMDDNLSCYKFQDSLENEADRFAKFIMSRTPENEQAYKSSGQETKEYLKELPYDYDQIGEARYAITWNILNCYGEYEKQKEKVIAMGPKEEGYIKELYKVYSMQDYLDTYASRLTKAVFTEGNDYYESQVPGLKRMPYVLFVISAAAFLVLVVELRFITGSIVKVLVELSLSSRRIEKNDFSGADVRWDGRDEIGQLVSAFNKMKHSTENYWTAAEENRIMEERLHRQELEHSKLEQRFSLAQLQLIKSQLNPHFLFNTLNMITRMAQEEEAPVTEEMLVAISNLLRYSIRTSNAFTPLGQELKVVKDYMYIQQMRFGERIRWQIDCGPGLDQEEVPVFLLQPLVENAVIHGISGKESGGAIYLRIRKKSGKMFITVADTGQGMSREHLKEIREALTTSGKGLGIGLGNIYSRIAAYYENGKVLLRSRQGRGTAVLVEFGKKKG